MLQCLFQCFSPLSILLNEHNVLIFFLNLTAQKTTVNVAVVVGEHHISPCCSPKKQILSSQCTQLKAKEH